MLTRLADRSQRRTGRRESLFLAYHLYTSRPTTNAVNVEIFDEEERRN
jgi:hypothetical protein